MRRPGWRRWQFLRSGPSWALAARWRPQAVNINRVIRSKALRTPSEPYFGLLRSWMARIWPPPGSGPFSWL